MVSRNSIILVDTMAIKTAHDLGCWNAIRNTFELHSVQKCVEEATRKSKTGAILVGRKADDLAAELTLGVVDRLKEAEIALTIGTHAALDDGERQLLAYALGLNGSWYLCGPDNGTVRAMQMLALLERMVSLEALAHVAGHRFTQKLSHHFTERWLAGRRLDGLLQ